MNTTLTSIAETTLEDRYLLRNHKGEVVETPKELWWRIAYAVAVPEGEHQEEWAARFHYRLENLDFLPNTPTIINAGKEKGQLSACFVLPIEDSMVGIFTTLKDTAIIHQTGGGTGFDFSRLRPEGSMVSNKTGVSTGPLSFAGVYNAATEAVKQGATRRGANMMNLRIDHPDILKFIDMKTTPGVMKNFNVSVTITDAFMEALEKDEEYELTHSHTGFVDKISARFVWDKIAHNAWKSAEPGIVFIDRINERSPYWERIEATNPCGEQPLPPYGSCNLGSINLANFIYEGDFDYLELQDCIVDCVRFLDNVIDVNCYPIPEIEAHTKKYRNIGLGVMGWADALIKLGIPYNSEEAITLGKKIQAFLNTIAHKYSIILAKEKGVPEGAPFAYSPSYSNAVRRNATLTTVAPTGTISMIAGCSSGIEPVFAFEMERHQLDRVMVDIHPLYKEAKENGTYDREVFVPSHEVEVQYHVRMQSAFQKHCDSAISKTINLPKDSTVEDVQEAYQLAWEEDCKGVTIYVEDSREGVLHIKEDDTVDTEEYCCENPNIKNESGCEVCANCGVSKCLMA